MSPKRYRSSCSFLLEYSAASSPTRRSLRHRRSAAASSVHVVVVATHADDSLIPLLYSCAILDLNVRVIGWKEELKGPREGWRARKILDLCEELDEDEVVVVLEGFSGLVLQQKEVILEKFQEFRGRIVCMALKTHTDLEGGASFSRLGHPKVAEAAVGSTGVGGRVDPEPHAGAFIGYAGSVVHVLAKAHQDDISIQALFSSLYKGRPNDIISIDENCSIFHRCHTSRSIRILSYAEAHAQAMHQSPRLFTSSPPSTVTLPSSTPPSGSHTAIPQSSHRRSSASSSTVFRPPYSVDLPHAVPTSPKSATALGRQQLCAVRPAPFFRPSPLQKIAMDAATGETPCFVHFSDGASAAAVLTNFGFFTRPRRHPQQWHQQDQLQQRHCWQEGLLRKYCSRQPCASGARTHCCRRLNATLKHTYAAGGILHASLLVSLLVVGVLGAYIFLAHLGLNELLPESLISWGNALLEGATAAASRSATRGRRLIAQAFYFFESITTFWFSIFVSCCVVGLCGAACRGSSKIAEEHIFYDWSRKSNFEEQPRTGVSAPLTPQEHRQPLRQESKQQHQNHTQGDSRERKEDEGQRQALVGKLDVEEHASVSGKRRAGGRPHPAVHPRKRSSKRQQRLRVQGPWQELQQHDGVEQQLLLHNTQEKKQVEQEQQATQQQDLRQVLHERRQQPFQQHGQQRRSVSRTRVKRGQRSRVDPQQGTEGKVVASPGTTTDCVSLAPPPPPPLVAPRRTRAAAQRAAAAAAVAAAV